MPSSKLHSAHADGPLGYSKVGEIAVLSPAQPTGISLAAHRTGLLTAESAEELLPLCTALTQQTASSEDTGSLPWP